jgi:hypothetical protein
MAAMMPMTGASAATIIAGLNPSMNSAGEA